MAFIITSESKGITAINMTCKWVDGNGNEIIYDVDYFNNLFGSNDAVITEVPDSQVYQPTT